VTQWKHIGYVYADAQGRTHTAYYGKELSLPPNEDHLELYIRVAAPEPAQDPVAWIIPKEAELIALLRRARKVFADQGYSGPIVEEIDATLSNPAPPSPSDARDAARYRHMRNNATFQNRNGPGLYWYLPRWDRELDVGDRLDNAIDAAIAAEGK